MKPAHRPCFSSLIGLSLLLISSAGWTHGEHEAETRLDRHALSPAERLVASARVAQARHDFDRALGDIERALALDPHNDPAWLLAASIHLVRGDTKTAQAACRRLRYVPAIAVITCSARVSIARGESERVLQPLEAILEVIDLESTEAAWTAWAYSVAGDAARTVNPDAAVRYYEQSLSLLPNTQVRAALVDVLIEHNRLEEAARILDAGPNTLPLDIRQLIVDKRSGRKPDPATIRELVHRFEHWISHEDWTHAREMARFYLDVVERPALARRLAEINLRIQREPEDRLLALRAGAV